MEIPFYLAMTPAEIKQALNPPKHSAWMSAHFSSDDEGLSGLPDELSADSILVIDDEFPFFNHNSSLIIEQLEDLLEKLHPAGIILDFQKEFSQSLKQFSDTLSKIFPSLVAVTPQYDNPTAILFLPPVPPYISIQDYLAPWKGRKLWLDIAMSSIVLQITHNSVCAQAVTQCGDCPVSSAELCTHYSISAKDQEIEVQFHRTKDDCYTLLQGAAESGITKAIGLFQEFAE